MNKMLSETLKIDVALEPQTLPTAANDTDFFSMRHYGKALFCVELGAMAAGDTVVIVARESDDDGATSQNINIGTAAAAVNVTDTVTANTDVVVAQFDSNGANPTGAGDTVTVTIDGEAYVFTADAAPTAADREYAPGADGEASAANLAALINSDNGIPGVVATASAPIATQGRIVLEFEDKGEGLMTIATAGGANEGTASTVKTISYIEVAAEHLSAGFDSVGVRVTPTATPIGGVVLLRGAARYTPVYAGAL